MKEYFVRVEETTWVYVDADNEEDAIIAAYEKAWRTCPDEQTAEIIDVSEDDDGEV